MDKSNKIMEDDGDEDWMTDDEKSVSSAKNRSGQSTKFSETSLATEKLVFSTASAPRKAKQKERKLNQKSCNNTFSSNSVSSSSLQGLGFQKESHSSSSQKNLIGLYRTSESNLELLGQKNRMNSQYKEGDSFKPQSEKQVGSNAEPPAALIKPKKKVKISQSSLYEQNKKTKEDVGLTFNFGSKISSTQSFEVEKESKFLEQNKKDKAFKGKKQKPRANSKLGLIVVDEADHKKSGIDNQCVLEDQKNLKAENAYDGVLSLTLKLKQENGCLNSDNNEIFNSGKREIEESKSKRKQNSKNTVELVTKSIDSLNITNASDMDELSGVISDLKTDNSGKFERKSNEIEEKIYEYTSPLETLNLKKEAKKSKRNLFKEIKKLEPQKFEIKNDNVSFDVNADESQTNASDSLFFDLNQEQIKANNSRGSQKDDLKNLQTILSGSSIVNIKNANIINGKTINPLESKDSELQVVDFATITSSFQNSDDLNQTPSRNRNKSKINFNIAPELNSPDYIPKMEIPQSNSQAIIKRDKVAPLRYDQPRKPKNIVETNINYILDIHGKSTHVSPTQITATKLTPDQQNIIIKSTKPPSNFATATKHLSERFSDPESARLTNRNSDLDFGRSSGRLYMPNNGGTPNRGQGDKTKSRNSKSNFQDYMDPADVSKGLRSGILLMGSLRINKHNRSDAYVSLDPVPDIAPLSHATGNSIDLSQDIYVFGEKARNRALEGEIVIIQLLQGEELKFNQAIVNNKRLEKKEEERGRQEKIRVSKELVEDDNNIVDVDDTDTDDMTRLEFGKVVSIAERKLDRKFVGVLSVEKHSKDSKKPEEGSEPKTTTLFWFKPNDKRVPWMTIIPKYIPEDFIKDPQSYSDKLWLASLESWPSYSNYPRAKIVSVLGQVGNIDIETEALLAENGVTWTDTFSPKVEACLPTLPWVIPESEFKKRKDLREKRIFSIDPPTARDLDDAVSCECIDELAHLYSVGVHIADVSYFVKPSSALDIEAAERATTVYLVQKAVPMLPRILSENLCSLNPNVDRLAFSVIFTINSITGEIVGDPWFGKTVIRSSAKLSYDHAQAVIDGTAVKSFEDTNELPNVGFGNGTKFENIKEDILKLYGISKVLRKLRFESGALAIHSVKLAFELVDGHPVASGIYLIKESNRLIEEFMLLANMAVAKKIAKSFPSVALLRSHSPPIARRLVDLLALAEGLGHKLNASSSGSLQASFEAINDLPTRSVLELLAVKSMKRARYVCAGSVHTLTGYHHYALNIPLYTHFTSPIRRYCDLIVHRMLEVSLETPLLKSQIEFGVQYNLKNIVHIANLCNSNKDAAKAVQDASSKLFLCIYIANVQERLIMQSENQTSEQNQLRIRTAQSGVLLNAIVYNISQRSFDVLISDLGLERRVWLEDLVDRNEIWGSEWDEGMLTVIWKRNTNWDFDLPRNMGEFPNKVIVNVDKTQASLIKFKNEQDEGLSTVGTVANNGRKLIQRLKMDTSQYREQKIRIFQRVAIRVQSNVQKSPAELKILAEYPGFMKLAQEDSDFTKDFKKWNEIRIIERGNACEQVCLGIVDDD